MRYRFRLEIFVQFMETSTFVLKGRCAICRHTTNIPPVYGYFKYWLVNGDLAYIGTTLRAERSEVRIPAGARDFSLI
jgi:hypothetical protein